MAQISPFRGIHYNSDRIDNLSNVMTPPYDVISSAEQQAFYDRDPNNTIRLVLNKTRDRDTRTDNRYTRAAGHFNEWMTSGVLIRNETPALFVTTIDFKVNETAYTRYGLIAKVGLEPFEKRVILPHERTFSKVRNDRLELMKACHANFCPVFTLFPDSGEILDQFRATVADYPPESDIIDDKGHRHRLWRIGNPEIIDAMTQAFSPKQLFIADGHHRYETALNYRNWLAETDPEFNDAHPGNGIMMYLCSMSDPGLTILPAHRLLTQVEYARLSGLLPQASEFFDIETFLCNNGAPAEIRSQMEADRTRTTMGVHMKNDANFYLMRLRPGIMDRLFGEDIPEVLRHLDVTVLTRLIFMEILGFDEARLDDETAIAYTSIDAQAIESVKSGKCDVAFILNPTGIDQVQNVSNEGMTMPRKSTYFYPKVITGQVLNRLKS
ncbi:MAG: DUF1015 domain-containing protein [Deltaproteobacteria bacterium]|nr:DUF1015 domain-containing protein [Deltaproteobacteria bacterium]